MSVNDLIVYMHEHKGICNDKELIGRLKSLYIEQLIMNMKNDTAQKIIKGNIKFEKKVKSMKSGLRFYLRLLAMPIAIVLSILLWIFLPPIFQNEFRIVSGFIPILMVLGKIAYRTIEEENGVYYDPLDTRLDSVLSQIKKTYKSSLNEVIKSILHDISLVDSKYSEEAEILKNHIVNTAFNFNKKDNEDLEHGLSYQYSKHLMRLTEKHNRTYKLEKLPSEYTIDDKLNYLLN